MKKILNLYKKIGETPLECIQRFQKENPEYANVSRSANKQIKMTYAGRLDPMAEGELLVLVGKECKNKEKYLELDKEYEVEILFGFSTDTYDVLGLAKNLTIRLLSNYDVMRHQGKVSRFLERLVGKQSQEYPPFSARTVDGKPLFQITKEDGLRAIKMPKKEIEIYRAELLKNYYITGRELGNDIAKRVLLVRGDFRQGEIMKRWEKVLEAKKEKQFLISKVRIKCSSGTYMRSIAHNIGESLGVPSLAFKIKRTKIFSG